MIPAAPPILAFISDVLTPEALTGFLVMFPLIALSLTFHEFWHAYSADLLGDPTARYQGRITLSPLAHLDPLGTLMLILGPIGWARPVPFNPLNFRNARTGTMITVAAGPLSNLALAIVASLIIRVMAGRGVGFSTDDAGRLTLTAGYAAWTYAALFNFVLMNVFLCLFNLIPLFPLDGHHLMREMLHGEARAQFMRVQHMGMFVLLALIIAPQLGGPDLIAQFVSPTALQLVSTLLGVNGVRAGTIAHAELDRFFVW